MEDEKLPVSSIQIELPRYISKLMKEIKPAMELKAETPKKDYPSARAVDLYTRMRAARSVLQNDPLLPKGALERDSIYPKELKSKKRGTRGGGRTMMTMTERS
jgi:hypothetical protein